MNNLEFARLEESMKMITKSVKRGIEDKVLDKWSSEERNDRIEEIEETIYALCNIIEGLTEEKAELEKAELEYQREKQERKNKINKITDIFKPRKKDMKVSERGSVRDDKLVSDKQAEYNTKENELKQISYEISGKINTLRQKLNRTDMEEYELISLINQLEEINKILE
jgi:hypothetical protein